VPWSLQRFHQSRQTHFITFSCYHRQPLLTSPDAKQTFETALERVRHTYDLRVFGYVVMPEHIHLLLSEPQCDTLADAIKSLKQGVSRRLIGVASISGRSVITILMFAITINFSKSCVIFIAIR
jgi:putative transposase